MKSKEEIAELERKQSIFYQIVLYRCLIVVEWCCNCLQADRKNCRHGLRGAVNEIEKWVKRFNKRVSRNIKPEVMSLYEGDAEFLYDVIMMANMVKPEDRKQFTDVMSDQIKSMSHEQCIG